jgi:hypothetical protein
VGVGVGLGVRVGRGGASRAARINTATCIGASSSNGTTSLAARHSCVNGRVNVSHEGTKGTKNGKEVSLEAAISA